MQVNAQVQGPEWNKKLKWEMWNEAEMSSGRKKEVCPFALPSRFRTEIGRHWLIATFVATAVLQSFLPISFLIFCTKLSRNRAVFEQLILVCLSPYFYGFCCCGGVLLFVVWLFACWLVCLLVGELCRFFVLFCVTTVMLSQHCSFCCLWTDFLYLVRFVCLRLFRAVVRVK